MAYSAHKSAPARSHVVTAPDIAAALDITYGIHAERRSIYRDIHEINLVALMLEQGINLEEASKLLAEDEDQLDEAV